jgi:2-iminobutanoate/2-iminopropanoate deaminase
MQLIAFRSAVLSLVLCTACSSPGASGADPLAPAPAGRHHEGMTERRIIRTDAAPAAIGPYSQAVVHGGLVYCSGQIALDPRTQELVQGGVEAQARRALQNLEGVLAASGSSLKEALRLTVYLKDIADFPKVNAVYAEFFPADAPPARATVGVGALPKGALVEIDCIAAAGR